MTNKTITRQQVEAILAAAESNIDGIPTLGVVSRDGFTLDKKAVSDLRDLLSSDESNAIFANEQADVRWTVEQWLESAKSWKLATIEAACVAALAT